MLAMQTLFVALFLLVSFGETLTQKESKNVRTKHLFVQRKGPRRGSSLPSQEIHLPENGDGSAKLSQEHSRRSRRSTRQRRSASKDPTHTVHRFNDNHYMLYVHWTGIAKSKTVVVLSRDIRQTSTSTSYLYVSNNYGVNYKNQSHKLTYSNNKQGLIDKFYASPNNETWYIFADTTNKGIFTSKTDCETFTSNLVHFKPSDITFHGSKHNGIMAYDDETKILYYSNDFGATWNEREKKVKSYYWGIDQLDSNDTVYIEIDNGNGTSSVIRGHWNHKHYTRQIIRSNVIDFEINDGYMFETQKGKNGNLDLYVSYHFHDRVMAKFPNELKRKDYFIADASEGQVFVAVNHNKNTSHLYISDTRGEHYTLSMERVLFYSPNRTEDIWLRRYSQEEFVDIHPVASIRGIYVASQLNSDGKITTKISFDKGRSWKKVNAPIRHANGSLVQCVTQGTSCSLHLALLYAKIHPWYFAPSIKSRKSAPGLIVSSGNIGQTLNRHANLYVSNNAGESWLEVLQGRWYFNFGDHGGIIVAVRQWSPTKELRYSTDEGLTWKKFQFTNTSVHVYGVLTEPGETTTIFTIFGSYGGAHSWIVIQVNTSNVLGRPCTNADYETWTPYYRGNGYGCILGQRLDYERRKRNSTCYNGHNYDRPIKTSICSCSEQDYECDSGFIPWWFLCKVDPNAGFNPHAPPRPCPYGTTYNDSQGYRKIAGDKCSGGDSAWWYEPRQVSCPFKLDPAFLLYAERTTIQYVDLTNNNRSTHIQGLRGAVAVAYDRNDDYIYWADIKTHMIYGRGFQKQEIKAIAGVKQVEGLDFDWTTQNLYWVDSAKKVIEVCRKDGLYRKTVHIDKLDKPRALALDPPMGEMFWTDWGQKPKIEMSDMDGKNRVILVDSDIVWPNGLAIDIYNRKSSRILYYTDAKLDKIGSYNMHTKKKKVLASRSDHKDQWGSILLHPYSIAVDDIYVYWDDWQSGKVFKIHKSFTGKVETLVNRNTDLPAKSRYEIKVYYSGSQVDTSACTHKQCPQLCLPKPNKKYVCECADDLVLDPKTNECKCIGGLITLKNGTCKRPSGSTCAPHEFACNNGYCISQEGRCDWYDDCGDSSDERGCGDVKHCDDGEYACIGGKCISRERLCDGLKDCPTGDDEKHCVDCQDDQLRCDDGNCIPNDAVCDGQQDCEDNSDEKYCNHECDRQYQFECYDLKQCINASLRCDRHPDCNDGSDEKNCDGYCLPRFKCNDGIGCIDPKKQCDNVTDCSDGSDELCHMSQGGGVAKKFVAQKSSSKKTLMWAIPVGIVFVVLLGALAYFMVKSRRLQRSFYHLVRSDSFDQGVTYHNAGDDDDTPLIQGFSDDDPLVEA